MSAPLRVGFTYDLREDHLAAGLDPEAAAEFDKPATIDGIAAAIEAHGHTVDRIGNLRRLAERLVGGDRWDLVFNIAEGIGGFAREAQAPALLEGYGVPYVFSDALTLALCLHKGFAKRIVRDAGLPTPRFLTAERGVFPDASGLAFPLFAKPVAEGTGKGVEARGRITAPEQLAPLLRDLWRRFDQPVLVEEYLPGREFTVGIAGSGDRARVIGVMEIILLANAEPGAYSFNNKDQYLDRVRYRIVDDAEAEQAAATALAAYRTLGCRDAGRVDLRSDASGVPQFMEINPLAGLDPVHSDLPIICRLRGIGYETLLGWILDSARERL